MRGGGTSGKGHLLIRPIGQLILAEAIAQLAYDTNATPHFDLEVVFTKLKEFDIAGGFENVMHPSSCWYEITYSASRQTMIMENKALAVKLIKYLLGGIPDIDDQKNLLMSFRAKRAVSWMLPFLRFQLK